MSDAPAYGSVLGIHRGHLVMFGFLLQWPALITLVMLPVLVSVYARLANSDGRDAVAELGAANEANRKDVPAFSPTFGKHQLQSRSYNFLDLQ